MGSVLKVGIICFNNWCVQDRYEYVLNFRKLSLFWSLTNIYFQETCFSYGIYFCSFFFNMAFAILRLLLSNISFIFIFWFVNKKTWIYSLLQVCWLILHLWCSHFILYLRSEIGRQGKIVSKRKHAVFLVLFEASPGDLGHIFYQQYQPSVLRGPIWSKESPPSYIIPRENRPEAIALSTLLFISCVYNCMMCAVLLLPMPVFYFRVYSVWCCGVRFCQVALYFYWKNHCIV